MQRSFMVLILILSCFIVFAQKQLPDTAVIGTINNEPITWREIQFCKSDNQHSTFEVAARIKIQQLKAKELGLIEDCSYNRFLIDFKAENARRKSELENHEVIYGPTQFSEENYYNYKFSNLVLQLKQVLAEREFKITDSDLKIRYEKEKNKSFKMPDYIQVVKFEVNDTSKLDAIKLKILKTEKNQKNFIPVIENLKKMITETALKNVELVTFDPTVYQNYEGEERAEVMNLITGLKSGEFSKVSKEDGKYVFFQLIERKESGYCNFESVKVMLKRDLINKMYSDYIEKALEKAIIVRY